VRGEGSWQKDTHYGSCSWSHIRSGYLLPVDLHPFRFLPGHLVQTAAPISSNIEARWLSG
jgi:hypothetical protein